MTNLDYGFTTDDVKLDAQGLPVGTYKAMVTSEEMNDKNALVVTYEVVSGEHKGRTGKVWYNINHENQTTANIARQSLKRIADATGIAVSNAAPLKNRVMTIEVGEQKKDSRYTEIKKYLPEDYINTKAPF